ncbi:hypothetical protein ACFFRR_004476 [Megaselia abdita]
MFNFKSFNFVYELNFYNPIRKRPPSILPEGLFFIDFYWLLCFRIEPMGWELQDQICRKVSKATLRFLVLISMTTLKTSKAFTGRKVSLGKLLFNEAMNLTSLPHFKLLNRYLKQLDQELTQTRRNGHIRTLQDLQVMKSNFKINKQYYII